MEYKEYYQKAKQIAGKYAEAEKQVIQAKRKISKSEGRPSRKVQSAFLSAFAGVKPKSKGGKVGRPRGILKHISPLTGKPIPAQQYYSELRFIRRKQSQLASQRQLAILQQMARRGIPQRQNQPTQMPTQQVIVRPVPSKQIPQQFQSNQSIWNRRGFIDEEADIMGNRRRIIRGTPQSFWN